MLALLMDEFFIFLNSLKAKWMEIRVIEKKFIYLNNLNTYNKLASKIKSDLTIFFIV